ncbi:MAG: diaminopimelate decarboxylase [Bacteroidetes bacterium GWF2_38_335]|nr:MAG: diaminopimelate decarboxylase [Bacteroidetes bacterium GWF2_38_335]OFY77245.1 MAG: diaminopimelate decarboxylase [Bacteroidetes bacterium RIFOXYA12_FULL_38_20]HBS85752.1 diaminopimelate decarboxylase [Bacteroidales bacterium]
MEKLRFERPIIKRIETGMPNKFGTKTEYDPISHIDGVAVADLIKKYGSPLFVVSEKTIRKTFNDAKRSFYTRYPRVQFAWSYKTNYLDAVCRVFHDEGSWAEVVSGFEYDKAIRNGVKGDKIIFNGPDKSEADLEKAAKNGSMIHLDHFDELYTLIELAEKKNLKPKVAVRVNMDTGIYPSWDRFGFNYENGEAWDAINRIMLNKKLELVGLHTHIGTYILSVKSYGIAASKLSYLASEIEKKYGHAIKYIDMGGGFASKNTLKGAYLPGTDTCPSFDEYAESITSGIINSEIKPENLPFLILESGRALIDDAGYIIGTTLANKRLPDGRRSMIIDVGVNLLFTSFWYEHKITPAHAFTQHTEDTTIFGPLCMNIDVIRQNISFPVLKKGDQFVISKVGAYNMTQWLQFITLRPKIVLIDLKKGVHIIRESETAENFIRMEKTPEHLTSRQE